MTVILLFSISCGKSEQPKTTFAGSRGDPSRAKGYSDLEEVGRHTGRIGRCPDQAAGDGAIYFARLTRTARLKKGTCFSRSIPELSKRRWIKRRGNSPIASKAQEYLAAKVQELKKKGLINVKPMVKCGCAADEIISIARDTQ